MGVGQTEQTEKVCRPDQSDQNLVIWQTEQTKVWVLTRPSRPKYGSQPERTDQKIWYYTIRTDRNTSFGQTDHTEIWVLTRENRTTKLWVLG